MRRVTIGLVVGVGVIAVLGGIGFLVWTSNPYPPMPFNLAFFDANRARDAMAKYPLIKRWAIGGHSLGGVAAAMFVKSHTLV